MMAMRPQCVGIDITVKAPSPSSHKNITRLFRQLPFRRILTSTWRRSKLEPTKLQLQSQRLEHWSPLRIWRSCFQGIQGPRRHHLEEREWHSIRLPSCSHGHSGWWYFHRRSCCRSRVRSATQDKCSLHRRSHRRRFVAAHLTSLDPSADSFSCSFVQPRCCLRDTNYREGHVDNHQQ